MKTRKKFEDREIVIEGIWKMWENRDRSKSIGWKISYRWSLEVWIESFRISYLRDNCKNIRFVRIFVRNFIRMKWISHFSLYNGHCGQRHLTSVVVPFSFKSNWTELCFYSLQIRKKHQMENEENESSTSQYDLRTNRKRNYMGNES